MKREERLFRERFKVCSLKVNINRGIKFFFKDSVKCGVHLALWDCHDL